MHSATQFSPNYLTNGVPPQIVPKEFFNKTVSSLMDVAHSKTRSVRTNSIRTVLWWEWRSFRFFQRRWLRMEINLIVINWTKSVSDLSPLLENYRLLCRRKCYIWWFVFCRLSSIGTYYWISSIQCTRSRIWWFLHVSLHRAKVKMNILFLCARGLQYNIADLTYSIILQQGGHKRCVRSFLQAQLITCLVRKWVPIYTMLSSE